MSPPWSYTDTLSEELDRLSPLHLPSLKRFVGLDDLLDARLDLFQVFRCERPLVRKIVIEAFFDRRPDGELRGGKEVLDRLRHDVGAAVTVDFLALRHLEGHRTNFGVGLQRT